MLLKKNATNNWDMGTKQQVYNVQYFQWSRLTPEGMVKSQQKELFTCNKWFPQKQNKRQNGLNENKSKSFELQPNEVQFIMDTMREVSTMEDGRAKMLN